MSRARRMLLGAAIVAAVAAVAVAPPPQPTVAAWTDAEVERGAVTAGVVNPPTGLTCARPGARTWRFTWVAPATGLPAVTYQWRVVAGGGAQPFRDWTDLAATATNVLVYADPPTGSPSVGYNNPGGGLGTTGSGNFQVRSVDAGGWFSVPSASVPIQSVREGTTANPFWTSRCL